jgi:hypothetical protein
LLPLTALEEGQRQNLYRQHGIEIIVMPGAQQFCNTA